jgi:hypothetical protein
VLATANEVHDKDSWDTPRRFFVWIRGFGGCADTAFIFHVLFNLLSNDITHTAKNEYQHSSLRSSIAVDLVRTVRCKCMVRSLC